MCIKFIYRKNYQLCEYYMSSRCVTITTIMIYNRSITLNIPQYPLQSMTPPTSSSWVFQLFTVSLKSYYEQISLCGHVLLFVWVNFLGVWLFCWMVWKCLKFVRNYRTISKWLCCLVFPSARCSLYLIGI